MDLLPQPDDAAGDDLPALPLQQCRPSPSQRRPRDDSRAARLALWYTASSSPCSSSAWSCSSSPWPCSAAWRATSPRSSERGRLRRRRPQRLQAVPPVPREVHLAQGAAHPRREASADEDLWALATSPSTSRRARPSASSGATGRASRRCSSASAGSCSPPAGEVVVRGKLAGLLELGAGFQQDLSGRENIYLNGSMLGMSKREVDRVFDDIVDFAELEQFIDNQVKFYSSGMYVRLGLRRCRQRRPRRAGDRRGAGGG